MSCDHPANHFSLTGALLSVVIIILTIVIEVAIHTGNNNSTYPPRSLRHDRFSTAAFFTQIICGIAYYQATVIEKDAPPPCKYPTDRKTWWIYVVFTFVPTLTASSAWARAFVDYWIEPWGMTLGYPSFWNEKHVDRRNEAWILWPVGGILGWVAVLGAWFARSIVHAMMPVHGSVQKGQSNLYVDQKSRFMDDAVIEERGGGVYRDEKD